MNDRSVIWISWIVRLYIMAPTARRGINWCWTPSVNSQLYRRSRSPSVLLRRMPNVPPAGLGPISMSWTMPSRLVAAAAPEHAEPVAFRRQSNQLRRSLRETDGRVRRRRVRVVLAVIFAVVGFDRRAAVAEEVVHRGETGRVIRSPFQQARALPGNTAPGQIGRRPPPPRSCLR